MRKENGDRDFKFLGLYLIVIFILFLAVIKSVSMNNTEFTFYILGAIIVLTLFYYFRKKYNINYFVFGCLSVIFLFHSAGGLLRFSGTRLYDTYFLFLRYDNILHFTASFFSIFIVFHFLDLYLKLTLKRSRLFIFVILTLMGMGMGTIVEMTELSSVLFFNGAAGVGDYLNNAFDLVFNCLGSLLGSLILTSNFKFFKKL